MTPLSVSVPAIVKIYAKNPSALVTALEGLVQTHLEQLERRDAKALAAASCRKLHEGTSDKVVCEGCFLAALERINGE